VSPNTKVVILSGSLSPALVADAIAQGAVGYISKEKPIQVIVGTLTMVHDGYLGVDPLVLQEALRPRDHNVGPLWMLKFLTPREWEVLRCIVDGLSTDEIAAQYEVQRSTARTHVQNLLSKLGVHSRVAAVALMTQHATEQTWPVHLRARQA
jgi:two-component system, NarL family, nitrate/nitrite response regulator NarL